MTLQHLRSNAVAYLALAVALGTGTASAADNIPNGSVTGQKIAKNAVTSSKIKTGAVKAADLKDGAVGSADIKDGSVASVDIQDGTVASVDIQDGGVGSADIKDGSVSLADVAPGLLPEDATLAVGHIDFYSDPPAVPDVPVVDPFTFTLAAAGDVYLRYSATRFGLTCSSGSAPNVGMTFDGASVPASSTEVTTAAAERAFELVNLVEAGAGEHTVAINVECATGTWTTSTRVDLVWTVIGIPA